MKIIIDLQGLQREGNRKRGIGRYCLELTKALINYYPENEYILLTNSALCNLKNDFSHELKNKKNLHNTILFSPAAASFDQFKKFEDRGKQFKNLIKEKSKIFFYV